MHRPTELTRLPARSVIVIAAMDGNRLHKELKVGGFRVASEQHPTHLTIAVLLGDVQEAGCSLSSALLSSLILCRLKDSGQLLFR